MSILRMEHQGSVGSQVSQSLDRRGIVRARTEVCRQNVPNFRTGRQKLLIRSESTNEQKKRVLSVSDLLDKSTRLAVDSDTLFPRIDKEKYQSNAPATTYLPDLTDTEEDMATYFQEDSEGSGPVKDGYYRMKNVTSMRGSIQHSIEDDEARDSHTALKPLGGKGRMRKVSFPVSILSNAVTLECESSSSMTPSIWFGCHMIYMLHDKRLMVQMERRGSLLFELSRKPLSLVAKLRLMPGNIQKQKVEIVPENDDPLKTQRAFFRGLNPDDLSSMRIDVKVLVRRGMFRKSQIVHEWSIRLSEVNLQEKQTAWKQIQWKA